MLLSQHDRAIILAALQWAAMEHDKISKTMATLHRAPEAMKAGALSVECARVADLVQKG